MVARVTTYAFEGVKARPVDVQVQLASGMANFMIVGLADKAVAESRERVRAAFAAIGLALPLKRIVVNLAPADLPKEGSHYDLAIALGLLAATGVISPDALTDVAAMGELGLDGALAETVGALPAAMAAEADGLQLACPKASGAEAAWSGGRVLAAPHLMDLIGHFSGQRPLAPPEPGPLLDARTSPDLGDVRGQEVAKRALEIAAAGGHNLLMMGPPGSGKSMLAARLPGLLPPLTPAELLEVSQILSVAGALERGRLSRERPFRAPHHSASMAAMVGGGVRAAPGEVSLAHHGVLFLDELPEFSTQVLESLRTPLETGQAVVARANRHVSYPARFQLVAAMNPCRCGGGPDAGACRRAPRCQQDYQARLSGPFLDRIDLFADAEPVTALDLTAPQSGEDTATVAARVAVARAVQAERFADGTPVGVRPVNADLEGDALMEAARPDAAGEALLIDAATKLKLSARAYHRVLKVARTIADLDRSETVMRRHIAEALSFRARRPGAEPTRLAPANTVNAS